MDEYDEFDDVCEEYTNANDFKTLRFKDKKPDRLSEFHEDEVEKKMFSPPPSGSQEKNQIKIIMANNQLLWEPKEKFEAKIVSCKKEKGKIGVKNRLFYQIIPSFSNIQVSRSADHFRWLNCSLVKKFSAIFIPSLPTSSKMEKSMKQDETLGDCKLRLLQSWLNQIILHPVLSESHVFKNLFLSCTDEKKFIKEKKLADKDFYIGSNIVAIVICNVNDYDINNEEEIKKFRFIYKDLEEGCLKIQQTNDIFFKSGFLALNKNCNNLASSFHLLSKGFENSSRPLKSCLIQTSELFQNIPASYKKKNLNSFSNLMEKVREYENIFEIIPEVFQFYKATQQKIQDKKNKNSKEENEIEKKKEKVTSQIIRAEINYFNEKKNNDFKNAFFHFLQNQIDFYQEVATTLKNIQNEIKI